MAQRKTRICNEKLLKETAYALKEPKALVKRIVEDMGAFIAARIKEGAFEGVMIPYFGKFQAVPRKIQNINYRRPKRIVINKGVKHETTSHK